MLPTELSGRVILSVNITSVFATPVKFAPLPTNDDAVTIPANSALPSTLILAPTPGDAPISIPCLAVTKPTESIFVTSSYVRAVSYTHLTLPTIYSV